MRARAYIETSVVSYLTARPTRSVVAAAWQQITASWWSARRADFDLMISDAVLQESARGDPEPARRRLEALVGIPKVMVNADVERLAARLLADGGLPPVAYYDALHVALAAVHRADYLVTWNCRHIDNAERKPLVRTICESNGHRCPEICTPNELMGDDEDA